MPSELNIVVAGGGLGIGFQTVTYLLQHTAAKLVVLDVDISKLTVLQPEYPDRLWAIAGDITNRGDREKFKELALQKLQTITSLVITAGVIGEIERIASFSPDRLVKTFNINLIGPILLVGFAIARCIVWNSLRPDSANPYWESSGKQKDEQ
jgi:NAD(P)-dependent dehydrogenase (short-subunit alcohol dehydrogenase family)